MQIKHLNKETTGGTVRNLDALYQLFPSCFTEAQDVIPGKMRRVVDWGKLRELLGEYVENGEPEWRVRRQVHDIYYCHLDSVLIDTLIAKGVDVSAIYDGVEISLQKRLH